MAKVLVDVVLNDGEDSTAFGNSFSSNENVEVRNPMVSSPNLNIARSCAAATGHGRGRRKRRAKSGTTRAQQ